jgi:hypothetical protein
LSPARTPARHDLGSLRGSSPSVRIKSTRSTSSEAPCPADNGGSDLVYLGRRPRGGAQGSRYPLLTDGVSSLGKSSTELAQLPTHNLPCRCFGEISHEFIALSILCAASSARQSARIASSSSSKARRGYGGGIGIPLAANRPEHKMSELSIQPCNRRLLRKHLARPRPQVSSNPPTGRPESAS